MAGGDGLTVGVTGPTGSIGLALARRLDRADEVSRVLGMARRPFNPADHGLRKMEYRQGDVLDIDSVEALAQESDVFVHLAFLILGSHDDTRRVNLEGSHNVFEAALRSRASRLIYTSSVAAYGFHDDNPDVLDETIPPRGTEQHYYSAQKAEVEGMLERLAAHSATDVYVFRPCIVAGPVATDLIEQIPFLQLGEKVPDAIRNVLGTIPLLRPVIPDPGVPLQLVHEDDVADALTLAIIGRGEPGTYNLAGEGEIVLTDLAHALGWYALPIPEIMIDITAGIVSRLPLLPTKASWISAVRVPVLMDCTKALEKLGWEPRFDALETLAETIHGAREKGLIPRP